MYDKSTLLQVKVMKYVLTGPEIETLDSILMGQSLPYSIAMVPNLFLREYHLEVLYTVLAYLLVPENSVPANINLFISPKLGNLVKKFGQTKYPKSLQERDKPHEWMDVPNQSAQRILPCPHSQPIMCAALPLIASYATFTQTDQLMTSWTTSTSGRTKSKVSQKFHHCDHQPCVWVEGWK
ncbi:hypothetical protein E2C01_022025 [Portunus trituberculatus]|uniref:Uncharacterized protein n=1 Tax=Portunus trituberculatus TaxID=210409 RepID=A0A5B7E663_PORTR|nr:hypothetical protein [Portunus trituberculatus]